MTKKKQTHVDKKPNTDSQPPPAAAAVSAADEAKFENLKTLNQMLLEETKKGRKQVEALVLSKGSLESELNRSESEKESLRSELNRMLDRTDSIELEREVVSVFAGSQLVGRLDAVERERDALRREKVEVEERVRGLEREVSERDRLEGELGVKIEKINELRTRLGEVGKRERWVRGEIEDLREELYCVVKGKEERERTIEEMTREKGSLERGLGEANRVIDELKGEIAEMGRAMREMEEQGRVEAGKKTELEKKVSVMNELLVNLRNEEKLLRVSVENLEKRGREKDEQVERITREIGELERNKEERERCLERLVVENDKLEKSLNVALNEIDGLNQKIDEIIREKDAIEEAKKGIEGEMVGLKREIHGLKVAISVLEAESKEKMEENMGLSIEVNQSREEIVRLTGERDDARKGFKDEREICVSLREKVSETENKIKETEKVLNGIQSENLSVLEEKKDLKGECDDLKNKVASLEGTLLKDNNELDNLRAKLLKTEANFGYVLKIVKGFRDGELASDEEGFLSEEIMPFVDELTAVRREIREGEAKVEEMKKQVESLNNSVESHKKKSFWAVVSSATTVFAAASVASAAYIARGH